MAALVRTLDLLLLLAAAAAEQGLRMEHFCLALLFFASSGPGRLIPTGADADDAPSFFPLCMHGRRI